MPPAVDAKFVEHDPHISPCVLRIFYRPATVHAPAPKPALFHFSLFTFHFSLFTFHCSQDAANLVKVEAGTARK